LLLLFHGFPARDLIVALFSKMVTFLCPPPPTSVRGSTFFGVKNFLHPFPLLSSPTPRTARRPLTWLLEIRSFGSLGLPRPISVSEIDWGLLWVRAFFRSRRHRSAFIPPVLWFVGPIVYDGVPLRYSARSLHSPTLRNVPSPDAVIYRRFR